MSEIKPFRAVYYNEEKVKNLARVVCPPYDVISPQQQDAFYNESEYNFIRVLLGKDKATDDKRQNKYTRAKQMFEQWLKDGVLLEDKKPSLYFYKQEYNVMGQKHSRLGFISLMKVQDPKVSKIFPHEKTHSSAKEDRLKLWRTLSSNTSPIFVCFSDREKRVEQIFSKHVIETEPLVNIINEGIRHMLWRLDDPKLIKEVAETLAGQELFIADGHHRYEVAQEYRRLRMSKAGRSNGSEPFHYVMTYFTNIDSRDLKIFPMHRIVSKLPQDLDFLEEYFRSDKVKTKEDLQILLAKAGRNEHAFGLYRKKEIKLLRLKHKSLIDQIVKEGSKEYRRLDAIILKNFIFEKIGVASEDIIYTKDAKEAMMMVDDGRAEASFIMNPVKIQQLKQIALQGERMPPKTTYFYPKVLSGLTIYKMGS